MCDRTPDFFFNRIADFVFFTLMQRYIMAILVAPAENQTSCLKAISGEAKTSLATAITEALHWNASLGLAK